MIESGYYPPGAEHDPNAPWNQQELEPVSQDVEYSCTMTRNVAVETTNYTLGSLDMDDDGFGYRDGNDFTDTNWLDEYHDQHCTPQRLVELLCETAKKLAQNEMPTHTPLFWESVIKECQKWRIDDEYIELQ